MHADPAPWAALLDRLADMAVASLRAQVAAGAQAVQLFDSWAGSCLRPSTNRLVLPATAPGLGGDGRLGVPAIHLRGGHRRAPAP